MKILLLIAMLLAIPAQSAEIEATYGVAVWERSDNGTWWETPFPEKWPTSTDTWSIGYTDKLTDSIRWHVGYANLGTMNSYGEAVPDPIYHSTHGCTTGPCPDTDHWYGTGGVDGVYFTLSPEYKVSDITYSVEFGVWNYKSVSTVVVPDQHMCWGCPPQYAIFQSSQNRQWGQIYGLGASYKDFFLRYRIYWVDSSDREFPAIYQRYTHDISIGYRF